MDPTHVVQSTQSGTWHITQQTVAGKVQPPQVNASGRRFEWQQDANPLKQLLQYARGVDQAPSGFSKEVLSKLNSNHLNYQRFSFSETGILLGVIQRIIPIGVASDELREAFQQVEGGTDQEFSLVSAQSLHLQKRKDPPRVSYSIYLSASHTLMADTQRLCRILGSFSHDWGLYPVLLEESEELTPEMIANSIQSCDLFMALVDGTYAGPGTRSQTEVRIAQELASCKSLPWIASIFFDHFVSDETTIFTQSPALFLYGKSPKESLERMASFSLTLLVRKRSREQGH